MYRFHVRVTSWLINQPSSALEVVAMPPPLAGAPGAAGSGQELTVPPRSVPARRVEEDNGTQ